MLGRWRRARRPQLDVAAEVESHLAAGRPTGWFEPVHAAARTDPTVAPWYRRGPHPYLLDWLERPVATPPGRRAVVVGCGDGQDAAAVARAGYDLVAFDVSPTAVERTSKQLGTGAQVEVADVLDVPSAWVGAFDLVVEVDTVPWLPGVVRDGAMSGIASLVAPRGVAMVVTRVATSSQTGQHLTGPPWPQAPSELTAYQAGGLIRLALEHPPAEDGESVLEVRLTWQRPAGAPPPTAAGGGLPLVPG